MSDRKYRQAGYQDNDRQRRPQQGSHAPRQPAEPYDPRIPRDPRVPNVPGFFNLFRCVRCGNQESTDVGALSKCGKCGVDLHTCIHCASFDAGAVYECMEPIPERISPKDARNECDRFSPRVNVERATGSAPAGGQSSAKKAFDDLFKF